MDSAEIVIYIMSLVRNCGQRDQGGHFIEVSKRVLLHAPISGRI